MRRSVGLFTMCVYTGHVPCVVDLESRVFDAMFCGEHPRDRGADRVTVSLRFNQNVRGQSR